ncbi:hypothetical protein DFH28DRAFT_983799, partial [Melampsora americana]
MRSFVDVVSFCCLINSLVLGVHHEYVASLCFQESMQTKSATKISNSENEGRFVQIVRFFRNCTSSLCLETTGGERL